MEKRYGKIAEKMGVDTDAVRVCVEECVQKDMENILSGREMTDADCAVRDIIKLFYCISIDDYTERKK